MYTLNSKKMLNIVIPMIGTLTLLTIITTYRSRMISAAEYEQPVFTEGFSEGWSIKPINVSIEESIKDDAFQGNTSIEITSKDVGKIVFSRDHLLDISATNTFSFATKTDALRYDVTVAGLDQNGELLNQPVTLSSNNNGKISETGWRTFSVNTEDFVGSNTMISAVSLTFSLSGSTNNTILIDDVAFIDAYREKLTTNTIPVLNSELSKDWSHTQTNANAQVTKTAQKSELSFTPGKFGSITISSKDEINTREWPFLKLTMRVTNATQRFIMTFNSSQGEEYTYFFNPVHTLTENQDTAVIIPLLKAPSKITSFSIREINGTEGKTSFISDIAFIKGDN